jgi:H/ACA ribonucleoprotein complex subunit 4
MLKKTNGFVLLDKPAGITSFQAVKRVEIKIGSKKSGHTGTLDFNVTGLLLIALGEARKTLPLLMGLDKEYEGEMHLHDSVTKTDLADAFKKFTGKITQLPPVRSRVARNPRVREIHSLNITSMDGRDVHYRVHCQHGTYIRKLIHDIGEHVGCGAHMTKLRRTRVGVFSIDEAKPLENMTRKDIFSIEDVMDRLKIKRVWLDNKEHVINKVRNGNPIHSFMIRKHDDVSEGECIGIFSGKTKVDQKLVAIGLVLLDSNKWDKKRPLVKTDRVLND